MQHHGKRTKEKDGLDRRDFMKMATIASVALAAGAGTAHAQDATASSTGPVPAARRGTVYTGDMIQGKRFGEVVAEYSGEVAARRKVQQPSLAFRWCLFSTTARPRRTQWITLSEFRRESDLVGSKAISALLPWRCGSLALALDHDPHSGNRFEHLRVKSYEDLNRQNHLAELQFESA